MQGRYLSRSVHNFFRGYRWSNRRKCSCSALVSVLFGLLGQSSLIAWFSPRLASAEERLPNIVLIVADDLGVNDLPCYGRRDHRTPHLDALAASGARFRCAYTAQPVCSPARAALLTGLDPARLHLTNFLPGRPDAPAQKLLQPVIAGELPLEEQTLAEWLRGAGYRTGMFGKWHLGGAGYGPAEQGFEVVAEPPASSEPSDSEGGKSEFAITRKAVEFIEANRDRPFFCYLAHHSPHVPLAARQSLVEQHAGAFQPTFAAMLQTLDESIGLLLGKLDELGLAERTIVIVTSDNGGLHVLEFPGTPATHNAPFRAGKGYLYEGGLRVPLLIRWPAVIQPGSQLDSPVALTDLTPTLLEAAGVDLAKTVGPLDGRSLIGLWRGESLPERPLCWHFPHYSNQGGRPGGAIRRGDWKLIENFEDGSWELFDLAHDPGESNNLASREPQRAAALREELARWRRRVGAQMCQPNPEFDPLLHRELYGERDPSRLVPGPTAAETAPEWAKWREKMDQVVAGRRANLFSAAGTVRLLAKDAKVHGETLRYEPESHKNVLGYWVNPDDWAEWTFQLPAAAIYEIEIQQGCGGGSGGAEVEVEVGGQALRFQVVETGHFQSMIQLTVGKVELAAGEQRLALKPRSKPGPAVMDIRRVVIRPVR